MIARYLRYGARRAGALLAMLLVSATPAAGAPEPDAPWPVRDAWIDGRLDTAYGLNPQLGDVDIQCQVEQGRVRLSGTVPDDIARELAVAIAEAIEGVTEVEDELTVSSGALRSRVAEPSEERSFATRVKDATTTAQVKHNLESNGSTRQLAIEVATRNDVVTLEGEVRSRKDRALAEMIARNTEGITTVQNRLVINEQT